MTCIIQLEQFKRTGNSSLDINYLELPNSEAKKCETMKRFIWTQEAGVY